MYCTYYSSAFPWKQRTTNSIRPLQKRRARLFEERHVSPRVTHSSVAGATLRDIINDVDECERQLESDTHDVGY